MAKRSKHKKSPVSRWLKEHFVPHASNNHHPHFFRGASIAALGIAVLILQALYLGQTQIVFKQTDFLAAVLPSALVSLTNEDRIENGLGTVEEDDALSRIAQQKAEDMAERGYFSHDTPEGHEPWWWLNQAGYKYQHAGENLAVNFSDSEEVEEAWMESPTHRANILKPVYTKIGIGVAKGTYKGEKAIFVVQLFATPPKPVVTTTKPTAVEPLPGARPEPAEETVVPTQAVPAVAVAESPDVLGTETPAIRQVPTRESTNLLEEFFAAVTSPKMLFNSALYGFLTLTAVMFAFAFLRRFRVPHPGVLVGSTVMTALFLAALYVNAAFIGKVIVPEGTQSANAISAVSR